MPMNVKPIPMLDERINDIRMCTAEIVNDYILPNEEKLWNLRGNGDVSQHQRRESHQLREEIKQRVWEAGLWAPHLPKEYGGMGLDFLAHAYMNEVLAYAMGAAALFGVVAPNSGNETLVVKYGTEEQKQKWLLPLIDGSMESGFSMTEPHNPGSDPRSLDTSACSRRGNGSLTPQVVHVEWHCGDFFIVMCRVSQPNSDHDTGQMVQIIVPSNAKGVNIVRGIGIWGQDSSDHCEWFTTTSGPGRQRFRTRRTRSPGGPGPPRSGSYLPLHELHRSDVAGLRSDGRACQPAQVHGGLLKEKQFIQGFIADSYIDIQAARLMTIHAAEKIDQDYEAARIDISAIKVFVPAAYSRVVDRAIQVWGPPECPTTCRWRGCTWQRAPCGSPTAPTRCTRSSSPRASYIAMRPVEAGISGTERAAPKPESTRPTSQERTRSRVSHTVNTSTLDLVIREPTTKTKHQVDPAHESSR